MGFNMTVCRVCFEAAVIPVEYCSMCMCVGWHDRPPVCRLLTKLAHLKTPALASELIAGGSLSSQKTYFVFSGRKTNSRILQFCKALSPPREGKATSVNPQWTAFTQSVCCYSLFAPEPFYLLKTNVTPRLGAKLFLNHLQQFQMKLFTVAGVSHSVAAEIWMCFFPEALAWMEEWKAPWHSLM